MLDEWKASVRNIFIRRRDAYRKTFSGLSGEWVLGDLARFCGWHSRNPPTSDLEMAYQEGRRDVYLRIVTQMNLTDDRIAQLIDQSGKDED